MLTSKQQEIKQEIINYIYDNTKYKTLSQYKQFGTISLTGSAGTGKTYLIKEIVKEVVESKYVHIVAPTHQALSVISEQFIDIIKLNRIYREILIEFKSKCENIHGDVKYLKQSNEQYYELTISKIKNTDIESELLEKYNIKTFPRPVGIELSTIHSLLGIGVDLTVKDLNIEDLQFDKIKDSKFKGNAVIIVDESSMLNSKILDLLFEECYHYNYKLIFIGDPFQLPPVNEFPNNLFSADRIVYKLNDIIRTKHRDITDYCNDLRKGKIYIPDKSDNIRIIPKLEYKFDDNLILAYTNNQVDYWNNEYKKYHHNDLKFKPGDIIRLLKPISDTLKNSTMLIIDTIELNVSIDFNFKSMTCVKLTCSTLNKSVNNIVIYIAADTDTYIQYYIEYLDIIEKSSEMLKYKYNNGGWVLSNLEISPSEYNKEKHGELISEKAVNLINFIKFKNTFLLYKELEITHKDKTIKINRDFQLANALTIHKSQGMSIPNVAVDYRNIFGNDLKSLIYTSMTRVSNRLTILV